MTIAALAMPIPALAASATQDAYSDPGVAVIEPTPTPKAIAAAAAVTPTATSSLPFTGLEAGLIAIAGLGLAGTGAFLRRAARDQH